MKSCFFIGHREASEEIFSALTEAVEHHIVHYSVTEFIVGNYGGFDRMAARAVISAKALYPGITLLLLLSYHPAERPVKTPPDFDGTFYPPGMESAPRRYAIARANRYMVLCKASHNTIYEKQMVIVYTSFVRFDLKKTNLTWRRSCPNAAQFIFLTASDDFRQQKKPGSRYQFESVLTSGLGSLFRY